MHPIFGDKSEAGQQPLMIKQQMQLDDAFAVVLLWSRLLHAQSSTPAAPQRLIQHAVRRRSMCLLGQQHDARMITPSIERPESGVPIHNLSFGGMR